MPPLLSTSWSLFDGDKKTCIFTADIKHQHVCRIPNIMEKIEMEPETELRADPFSILIRDKMVDWCLKICPNQNVLRNDNKKYPLKYIGVYLEKITDTEFPIEADIAFNSLTNNGTTITWEGSNNNVIFQDGNCRGLSTFMPHSSMCLRSKDKNESLTVICDIHIKGGEVNIISSGSSTRVLSPGDSVEERGIKFTEDMRNIFEAGKFTDVTIVCQKREFACHKAILSARSPVLEAMFSHNMKEKLDRKVEIQDMDADTCHQMVVFMYSGKVARLGEKAADLLVAAEKYDLKELKQMCEDNLCVNLNLENALDMLVLADIHGANNLRLLTLEFIGENGEKIVNQKGWREKVKLYPDLMANMIEALSVSLMKLKSNSMNEAI